MPDGGGGGGPAGSGKEHAGGGGNIGDSSTEGSKIGGGGIMSDDDITSLPLVKDDVISHGDIPFDKPFVSDDVMDAGWWIDCKARVDGGGGGMASDGAPSGFLCASVSAIVKSSISSANTVSSYKNINYCICIILNIVDNIIF